MTLAKQLIYSAITKSKHFVVTCSESPEETSLLHSQETPPDFIVELYGLSIKTTFVYYKWYLTNYDLM